MTDPLLTLLDIDAQVRRDQDQTPAFLHRRDRRFAIACHERGEEPGPRAWLDHIAALSSTSGSPSASPRAAGSQSADARLRPWRRLTLVWTLAGAILGVAAMLGLLFYDGNQQINLTVILGFIGLQLVLALLATGFALANRQPWGPLLDSLLARWRKGQQGQLPVLRQLQPQLAVRVTHLGGLVFALSAWLTLLVLVVVQDLAFGWSTTLDTAAASYHRLVVALATPWQALWPAAVPSLELVSESRFFRLEGPQADANAGRWGDWWPFVAMAWLFYVVLPRLLLLALAGAHLRWRVRQLLHRHPGLVALRYRMETPALEVGTGSADSHHQPDLGQGQALADWPEVCHALVRWAGAGEPDQARLLLPPGPAPMADAGGALSLAADREALARVQEALPESGGCALILTRAWEPPTAELADFLQDARQLWPESSRIMLVPAMADLATRPAEHQLAQWQRFVDRHPELRLQVSHPHSQLNPPTPAAARVATAGNPEPGL